MTSLKLQKYLFGAFLFAMAGCAIFLLSTLDLVEIKNLLLHSNFLFILMSTAACFISILLSSMKFCFWFSEKNIRKIQVFEIYFGTAGLQFALGFFGSNGARLSLIWKLFSIPFKELTKFFVIDKGSQLFFILIFCAYFFWVGVSSIEIFLFVSLLLSVVIDKIWRTRRQLVLSTLILIASLVRFGTAVLAIPPNIMNMEIAVAYSATQILPIPLNGFGLKEIIFSNLMFLSDLERIVSIGTIIVFQGVSVLLLSLIIVWYRKSKGYSVQSSRL